MREEGFPAGYDMKGVTGYVLLQMETLPVTHNNSARPLDPWTH
jgi:hypothetical protein